MPERLGAGSLFFVNLHLPNRLRRLRQSEAIRSMVRETRVVPENLVQPLFVSEKIREPVPVPSMPGVRQETVDSLVEQGRRALDAGVGAVLLFGIPAHKDETGSGAFQEDGIIQESVRRLKQEVPELVVITDVCLCEYTSHGHCGMIGKTAGRFEVLNDPSVEILAKIALSHARAGADMVAPSDMMDGRIGVIRAALDAAGFEQTILMSYAAKFASSFYGPFRDAGEGAPQFGDRRTYQMDSANAEEALREVALDVEEGADLVMVKPGMPCLDILRRVKEEFRMPTAVYQVSGEYAMIKAASEKGWIEERAAVMETLTAFRRAGADLILTYYAVEAANWLRESRR